QRDRRMGRRRRVRALLGDLPRRLRHASARQGAHRADIAADGPRRGRRASRRVARPDLGRARVLARAPRGPHLDLPRRAARRRSRAGRGPRSPQAGARPRALTIGRSPDAALAAHRLATRMLTDTDELAYAGAARQAELLRAGEIAAPELTELHLDR